MNRLSVTVVFALLPVLGACNKSSGSGLPSGLARFDAQLFTASGISIFHPLELGTHFEYATVTDGGVETIVVDVTHDTRVIMGVTCIVVRDTVHLDGELVEDTYDWFAIDKNGDLWYFGEDVKDYENGVLVSTEGSWEAGVDGALPGILVPAMPVVGQEIQQEYYEGEAEDRTRIEAIGETVVTSAGTFANCLKTRDFTPLEPGIFEFKYFAPGIGLVLIEEMNGTFIELTGISQP